MGDRHDDLDDWLSERIEPISPPPGTFDLIKRRARRRKYRKLAVAAGSAAVIAAAAVTVPQVVHLTVLSPPATSNLAGRAASVAPRTGGGITESTGASHPSFPSPSAAPPAPAPPNFHPTSVTFVGTKTGFVIGQAGTPGHCSAQFCTSVARTDDAGITWTGVPAPVTGSSSGSTGVSQIRFLNTDDGWAFGPELWATHDGGQNWAQVDTHGLRVTVLETVGDRAFAVFATCTGGGAAFAGGCTNFTLYSSPASADSWAPVGAATSGLTDGGLDGAASLALTERVGYLLAPDGRLFAGPVSGSASWQPVARIPCAVGRAQQNGQPAGALLGAENSPKLILACTPSPVPGGLQQKLIYASPDGGAHWRSIAVAPGQGVATSVAASPAETVVLATDLGMDVLPARSSTWRQLTLTGPPAGGFAFVGMTTRTQGVALPADPAAGTVWFTFDGGQTWAPSRVSS